MSDDFAPPLSKLSQSGIGVAASPAGGKGLALDANGKIPTGIFANTSVPIAALERALTVNDISGITPAAWSSYTPTWSSTGVQPAVNNGTITGKYFRCGNLVAFHADLTIGTTTTFGTGTYDFSLPVTALGTKNSGVISAFDSSAGAIYMGFSRIDASTTMAFWTTAQPAASYTSTVPFTWASGDVLFADLIYEAA